MSISTEERLSLSFSETFQDHIVVHDIFTRMRREEPVAWCPEPWGGPGFWSVTKYDDIQFVSKNPMSFGSDQKLGGITLPSSEMIRNRMKQEGRQAFDESSPEFSQFEGGANMIAMDPPDHNVHRRMVAPGFTPQKLDDLTPRIRGRCTEIFDRIAAQNECEFVASVAAELPIQMLAELLGVDQDRRHDLFNWSNIIIGADDPDVGISREHVVSAFMEMVDYAVALHAERLAQRWRPLPASASRRTHSSRRSPDAGAASASSPSASANHGRLAVERGRLTARSRVGPCQSGSIERLAGLGRPRT